MRLRSSLIAAFSGFVLALLATDVSAQINITQGTTYSSGVVAASSNQLTPWAAAPINFVPSGISYGVGSVFSVSSDFFLDKIEMPFYANTPSALYGDSMQVIVAEIADLSATTTGNVVYRDVGAFPVSLTNFDGNFGTIMSFDLSDSAAGLQLEGGQTYVFFMNWAQAENRGYTTFANTPSGSYNYVTEYVMDFNADPEPDTFSQVNSGITFSLVAGTYAPAPVPEPATYAAIFGVGALGLAAWRRRSRAATA